MYRSGMQSHHLCLPLEADALLGAVHKLRNRGWGGGVSPKDYSIT